jgi:hypothetical protein
VELYLHSLMRLYGMVLNHLSTKTSLLEKWEEVDILHGTFRFSTSLVAGFPLPRPECEPWSGHVGFVVDKVALW